MSPDALNRWWLTFTTLCRSRNGHVALFCVAGHQGGLPPKLKLIQEQRPLGIAVIASQQAITASCTGSYNCSASSDSCRIQEVLPCSTFFAKLRFQPLPAFIGVLVGALSLWKSVKSWWKTPNISETSEKDYSTIKDNKGKIVNKQISYGFVRLLYWQLRLSFSEPGSLKNAPRFSWSTGK